MTPSVFIAQLSDPDAARESEIGAFASGKLTRLDRAIPKLRESSTRASGNG